MGQTESSHRRNSASHEDIVRHLANKFAERCFSPIELLSLKANFKHLADDANGVRHLKEATVTQFLEIPDALDVSPVVFQMVSMIGAFPFLQDAPAVLGLEQLVMVISIMTERYQRVLVKGATSRRKLLFRSLAVFDRDLRMEEKSSSFLPSGQNEPVANRSVGFSVDTNGVDEPSGGNADDDDELVMSVLSSLNYVDDSEGPRRDLNHGSIVPADNFRRLLMLLVLISPLSPVERLSQYLVRLTDKDIGRLRAISESILASFLDVEQMPGVQFTSFDRIMPVCLPFLFNGLNMLFERFLFTDSSDMTNTKAESVTRSPALAAPLIEPLLSEDGFILSTHLVSQLSFFIPGSTLFHRLRPLYSGGIDGFSMGSFESKVFNWRAATILLVKGTRLPATAYRTGSLNTFEASIPPKRFPDGSRGDELVFGIYLSQPWRYSGRECFGDSDTILFQLQPVHDVMPASTLNQDYIAYIKSSAATNHGAGISAGNPPPKSGAAFRHDALRSLGPVSLYLDSSFEFGVFNHDYQSRGGAFQGSVSRRFDFQDRFEIESLEVWGCGGDQEAKIQAERWAFEAREAEARRRINLGTGDIDADRALLEMAGLVGANRSGGSMS